MAAYRPFGVAAIPLTAFLDQHRVVGGRSGGYRAHYLFKDSVCNKANISRIAVERMLWNRSIGLARDMSEVAFKLSDG